MKFQLNNYKFLKDSLSNEKGVSFLELAIVLPLLFIFVAGIIDYGIAIRQLNNLSTVTRSAARAAAKHSADHRLNPGQFVPCHQGLATIPCHNRTNAPMPRMAPVEQSAMISACNSLNRMGIGQDYSIEPKIEKHPFDDIYKINVTLKHNNNNPLGDRYCILCADTFIPALKKENISIRSSFVLDQACDNFVP